MATIAPHPNALPPMPAVARILAQFERQQLADFIEVAISLLDIVDGDTETEANGDEQDGSLCAEDEFMDHNVPDGQAGCPISDPGEVDDEDCGFDEGEPDFKRRKIRGHGAGCPISDPGGCEHDGREPEHEC